MTISCATCSSALEESIQMCPNCGTAVAAGSAIAETGSTDAPAYKHDDGLKGIGGWLILPAIGLAVAPFVALYIIFMVDLPVLTESKYQEVLTRHPALPGLLVFEIITNAFFLAVSLGLNFLFYKKKRILPRCIIAYLIIQFFLILADNLATAAVLPSANTAGSLFGVVRSLVGAVIWIAYFHSSIRVEATFVN
jgi:hypothetical protein